MATKFALNFLGARFRVKLVDCLTGLNVNVGSVVSQDIVFYRPDGTSFAKAASLVEDPIASGNFFINYLNTSPEKTILDQVGDWEFAGRVVLASGDDFDSAERFVFWVK